MADILLTHCNHLYYDRKQLRKMQPYPPLQTLLAAAVLRRAGFEIALFDSTLNSPEQGFLQALERHRPRLVVLCEDNFNFLTKMCLVRNRELAFTMSRIAKERGIPVVVSSSDATDHVEEYLGNGIDFVLIGEVEITLLEISRALLCLPSLSPEEIRGLAFLSPETGVVRYTRPREVVDNLDQLPLPDWSLVDIESYRNAWIAAHGYFSMNIVSSRGCPYHCNWCAKPIFGQSYHFRSAERVAEEMHFLKTAVRPDHLWFADDIFALSAEWTRQFAGAVEKLGAQIPFKMQSRCDLMTRNTSDALARAGCTEVWMGAESGSQKILDAMEKGILVEDIFLARENLRGHGIRACFFLQFGYPGETWDDIQSTIGMIRELEPDDIGISVSYPLPKTKFHDRVSAQLGAKRNWSDSEDLAMMFRGSYNEEFYRVLHNALHLELDLKNNHEHDGAERERLHRLWSRVEALEKTCINPDPTPLWTSC